MKKLEIPVLAVALMGVLALVAAPGFAQQCEKQAAPGVVVRVVTPTGHEFQVTTRPGQTATVRAAETGETLGLRLRTTEEGTYEIDALHMVGSGKGFELGERTAVLAGEVGYAQYAVLDNIFEVEVLEVTAPSDGPALATKGGKPDYEDPEVTTQCCLRCEGGTACGCAVAGSCGYCCGGCCAV